MVSSFSLITTTLLLLATITTAQTPNPTRTPPAPPLSDSCNDVFLSYTYTSESKLPPERTSNQPYRFESTLESSITPTNSSSLGGYLWVFSMMSSWSLASNAVIADGHVTFPGPVGNATVFARFLSADLKTAIETTGDVNQMSVEVDFVGTHWNRLARCSYAFKYV